MNMSCLVGRHELGPWELRPKLIGARVGWLRWERHCTRRQPDKRWVCRRVEQRWFQVRVPASFRPGGEGKAIAVEAYVQKIRAHVPPPETLPTSAGPPRGALQDLV